jgi:hypothetical protein
MNHQMYVDILVTALEGGINYWAAVPEYKVDYPNSVTAIVADLEGDDKPVELTYDLIKAGYDLLLSGKIKLHSGLVKDLEHSQRTGEFEGDSELADCIVQAAIFQDVIYS